MENKLEIVICTERGSLERQSKLLVESFRQFGGDLKDTPIYSYQPRKEFPISRSTKSFFEKNNVEFIDLELNKELAKFPFANKTIATAHREINSSADTIVFLDSDTLFFNEPIEFKAPEGIDLLIRPVGFKNIGASGPNDINYKDWMELYAFLGVKVKRYVTSIVDQQDLLEYYNSGHIVAKRSVNLYSTWNDNFHRVLKQGIEPKQNPFFFDQFVLGATISQMELKVTHFSPSYNYPVYFLKHRDSFQDHSFFIENIEDITSLHYHKIFERKEGEEIINNVFNKTAKGITIGKMLTTHKVNEKLQTSLLKKLFYKVLLRK